MLIIIQLKIGWYRHWDDEARPQKKQRGASTEFSEYTDVFPSGLQVQDGVILDKGQSLFWRRRFGHHNYSLACMISG